MHGYAGRIGQHGVSRVWFAAIHGRSCGHLPAAGSFGDAVIDARMEQVQPDQPVVPGQHQRVKLHREPRLGPLLHPVADGEV